jgi:glutathione synthase/RimK-type ligase-like ATP-grasp enzyme
MRPMRFAVVAHRSSDTNTRLVEAARACGLDGLVLSPRDALRLLEPGDVALGRLDVRESLDGIEHGTTELERLVAAGVDVLNRPGALAAAHDKLLTARVLRLAGLPHPRTWLLAEGMPSPAPELPLVLKPRFGSWGRDVERCLTRDDLEQALAAAVRGGWFREHGALAQELVPPLGSDSERRRPGPRRPADETDGAASGGPVWDLRLVVAGGRVVGAARRVAATGEWRTNAALGALVEPVDAPPLARTLAIGAAAAVRADLAGVDLLPTRNGFVVLEVNGAVDFRPLYARGSDVYADAVLALLRVAAERRAPLAV